MAKQVIYRRGTTAEHANFVGANGEITVDTVKHVVVVHDGVTAGGVPLANASAVNASISSLTANAANQATTITVLQANAATQSNAIVALQSNAVVQQAAIDAFTLASNSTVIFANIAEVRANVEAANVQISLLYGNATIQSESITAANANITALQANIAAANAAIAGIVTATTFVTQTAFVNNLLTLYPGKSLVKYNGADGSGTHFAINEKIWETEISHQENWIFPSEIEESPAGRTELIGYFNRIYPKLNFPKRVVRKIKFSLLVFLVNKSIILRGRSDV
jgi:hypothetical protein